MKKLLQKVFKTKEKIPTQDHITLLISRLSDPTDVLYDEEFAKGMNEEYENRSK